MYFCKRMQWSRGKAARYLINFHQFPGFKQRNEIVSATSKPYSKTSNRWIRCTHEKKMQCFCFVPWLQRFWTCFLHRNSHTLSHLRGWRACIVVVKRSFIDTFKIMTTDCGCFPMQVCKNHNILDLKYLHPRTSVFPHTHTRRSSIPAHTGWEGRGKQCGEWGEKTSLPWLSSSILIVAVTGQPSRRCVRLKPRGKCIFCWSFFN